MASLLDLHWSLRDRDLDRSFEICRQLRFVPLRFAGRVVALAAEENDPRYLPAAQRFLIRLLERTKPERKAMVQYKKVADAVAHVHHYYWQHEAMAGLNDAVGQLHEIERRERAELQISFDSYGERQAWR